jgi:arylmalonate decarboxylase
MGNCMLLATISERKCTPHGVWLSMLPDIRIGILVPAGNVVHEREFARLRPRAVSFRFAGFHYPMGGPGFCSDILRELDAPLHELGAWGARIVLLGCTTASMLCAGEGWQARLQEIAQVPVITAAAAVSKALTALNIRALAVATPYGESNNRIITQYLESRQVTVSAIRGMALDRSPEAWRAASAVNAEQMLNLALDVDVAAAEGLFLPCTGVVSLAALDPFERLRGKPALSSVQAGFWASLQHLGIDGRCADGGRLLRGWDF